MVSVRIDLATAAMLATWGNRRQAARALLLPASRSYSLPRMDDGSKSEEQRKRQQRLRAALRENLKRRKAQAKARIAAQPPEHAEKPHDSAGITDDDAS
jgi:hypothetical protein